MEGLPFDGRADLVFRTGGSFGIMIKEDGAPRLGSRGGATGREGNPRMSLQTDAAARAPQRLTYDGRLGELYGIFFVNLLLGIITLGIYRFWGRTRYRRYLWSHTGYDGDRFEYTGTGGELFRGFVIAMAILFLLIGGAVGTALTVGQEHPGVVAAVIIPMYLIIFVLFFASHYTALRYRLTRTQWRGIRGGLSGSAINFALRSIGYGILSGLTLYQFVPFATVRLWRYRLKNLFFGTAQATFEGHGRHLYPRYLGSFVLAFAAAIVVGSLFVGIMYSDIADIFHKMSEATQLRQSGGTMTAEETERINAELQVAAERLNRAGIVAYLAIALLAYLAFTLYWAFVVRYIAAGTGLADLRFESTMTARGLAGLFIGNLLLLVVTLGLGYPIVLQRIWRFGAGNFLIHGQLDGAVIEQSRLLPPRLGEGWLEVLDPGII
jgi:uncharacterized membrane protein YjgN (DUF898 family)